LTIFSTSLSVAAFLHRAGGSLHLYYSETEVKE